MEYSDIAIIGGGPCGLFAAFYAGMRGLSVRMIDSLPELGGQLMALYPEKYIYDMPGFPKVLAKDLAGSMITQAQQFSPALSLGETATRIAQTTEGWEIHTEKNTYGARNIIISAGVGAFQPTKIGIPSESVYEGKGLFYGVRQKSLFAGKKIAIIGGGDSAFDWCVELLDIASEIYLVHRRDQFRAHEETVQKVLQSKVNAKLFCTVQEIAGEGLVESILIENSQTKETERLMVDAVIVNIGYKSSLGPIKDWGLEIDRNQITVNPLTYETNLKNVFAVGDVCTYDGKLKLIANGVGEAVTAVCVAKTRLDPEAKMFPGHSSDRDL